MKQFENPKVPDLVLSDVRFSYGSEPMRFDLAVPGGTKLAITGPSGSGKTTLLNLVAGFEYPAGGHIFAGDTEITALPPHARPVSMIFQENNLFGHLTAVQNVILGVAPNMHPTPQQLAAAHQVLERTGLGGKEDRLPAQLSGGERQRVAIARALIRRRPYLLMDEPFASLGPGLREQMLDLLTRLHDETKITILFVTHHPGDIEMLADRFVFVSDGRIAHSGPAGELFSDKTGEKIQTYLGNRYGS